ncbi:DUF2069 domain-containing protein [Permianibacter aggregans]|uniref:Putative membrane protein n=1 Tax=Permianibacter aggregans TaxID=1510150 RepID=A0A4R6UKH3_9GAMM|nr:DUF2069 domain-containing protein [Permianibacter aggregans]QGX41210.1 DUF2069 domain-containing protein [Permianibacter aggregans]TDQ45813.1 putative membrane protein [Permianibacter aggregans]
MSFSAWHRLAVVSVLFLLALLVFWNWRVPTPTPLISTLIAVVPLLIILWPLLRGFRVAFVYTALIMLLYFSHAIVTLTASAAEWLWAGMELVLSIVIFVACLYAARIINQAVQRQTPE